MSMFSQKLMGAFCVLGVGIAGSATAFARDPARVVYAQDELAVSQISQGQLAQAEEKLTPRFADDRQDPARLINLGIVYAKSGKTEDAREAFHAAGRAPDCDIILADGREISSRLVARQQLAMLDRPLATR